MLKKIEEFEIVDHGVESEDSFNDFWSLRGTEYSLVVTGSGNTYLEALDNAIDQLVNNDYYVGCICNVPIDKSSMGNKCELCSLISQCNKGNVNCNSHRYVSIKVK